jgi:hypothetical protein
MLFFFSVMHSDLCPPGSAWLQTIARDCQVRSCKKARKKGRKTSVFVCVCVCVWWERVCVFRPRNTTREEESFWPVCMGGWSHRGCCYFVCGFSLDKWSSALAAAFYQHTSSFPIDSSSLGTTRSNMYIPPEYIASFYTNYIINFDKCWNFPQKIQLFFPKANILWRKWKNHHFENIYGDSFFLKT